MTLVKMIQAALRKVGLSAETVRIVENAARDQVKKLLCLSESIDLIIPRGGASLHKFCRDHSKIPVITGGIGICHLFVDESAIVNKSIEVVSNAKTQRPTVCND